MDEAAERRLFVPRQRQHIISLFVFQPIKGKYVGFSCFNTFITHRLYNYNSKSDISNCVTVGTEKRIFQENDNLLQQFECQRFVHFLSPVAKQGWRKIIVFLSAFEMRPSVWLKLFPKNDTPERNAISKCDESRQDELE